MFSPTYVDHVLAGAKKAEDDSRILGNLRVKIENVLRNFHRNSDHPEADPIETALAVDAVLRAVRESITDHGDA